MTAGARGYRCDVAMRCDGGGVQCASYDGHCKESILTILNSYRRIVASRGRFKKGSFGVAKCARFSYELEYEL